MIKPWTLFAGLAATALTPWSAMAQEVATPTASTPTVSTPVVSGQAGLDMVLTDPEGMPAEPEYAADDVAAVQFTEWSGAAADLAGVSVHHLYTDLRRALVRYQLNWGALPQVTIPGSGAIGAASGRGRLMALRQRLGLEAKGTFDETVTAKLRSFQAVHALTIDGLAGTETITALNRGSAHYERVILLNMERARRLPALGTGTRFIVVDAGAAMLTMYDGGQVAGAMKVVVGAPASQTPMIATQLRYAAVNPYWNVPPDLVAKLIAPKVLAQGRSYLVDRRYQVLSDWTEAATPREPETVNWQAVADQSEELRVRQLPGGGNSMGRIKFLMPNEHGIYLHDTPNRALFGQDDRWVSNGCVRLEDSDALARFVFGSVPTGKDADKEDRVDVEKPVPVYMTYLTAAASPDGVQFRRDPYARDVEVLAAMTRSMGPLAELAVADAPPDPLAAGFEEEGSVADLLAPAAATVSSKPARARKGKTAEPKPFARPVSRSLGVAVRTSAKAKVKLVAPLPSREKKPVVKSRPASLTKSASEKLRSKKAVAATTPKASASKTTRKKVARKTD